MNPNKLSREELIELVERAFAPGMKEEDRDNLLNIFVDSVPHPRATQFFTDPKYNGYTYEQKVDEALSYKPIQLPASSS